MKAVVVKIPGVQNRMLKKVIRYTRGVKQTSNIKKTKMNNIFSIQKIIFEKISETWAIIDGKGVNGIMSKTNKLKGGL
jgi:hypothetical protein